MTDEPNAMIVTAPLSLPGGYSFDVMINGKTIEAVVPEGGCVEGDSIKIYLDGFKCPEIESFKKPIPYHKWRYNLFDCYNTFGSCLCLIALLFPCILTAQLMQRFKLNTFSLRGRHESTFITVICLMQFVILIQIILLYSYLYQDLGNNYVLSSVGLAIFSYGLTLIHSWNVFLRIQVRRRYQIPETCIPNCYCDDCCIALWCNCCSLLQISQQLPDELHDKESDYYYCCSPTGLEDKAVIDV